MHGALVFGLIFFFFFGRGGGGGEGLYIIHVTKPLIGKTIKMSNCQKPFTKTQHYKLM